VAFAKGHQNNPLIYNVITIYVIIALNFYKYWMDRGKFKKKKNLRENKK
jgi:hypothetical protein